MAQSRMTLNELKTMIASMISSAVIADSSYVASKEGISGLINKIMAEVVIDGSFVDKLPELDGDYFEFGQAIEEWYTGLVPAKAFNNFESSGNPEDTLKPYRPTFDEVVYSERLEKQTFATTVDNDLYQVAFTNASDYGNLVNLVIKRLYDSLSQYKFGVKKALLGKLAAKAKAPAIAYTTNSTICKAGHIYSQSGAYYITNKNWTAAVNSSLATLAAQSNPYVFAITLNTYATASVPVDTVTAEAFIKVIKAACEDAQFVSEGTSISGSTIGAEEGLTLYIKKGVMPVVEVDALAGAFNEAKLAVPARIKIVDDFGGEEANNLYALLVDDRGIKLHTNYQAVREQENAQGDYWTYFLHYQATGYYSNHTFVKAIYSA